MQTSFDVGYLVTEVPTTATYVSTEASEIVGVVRMINRIRKVLKTPEAVWAYGECFRDSHGIDLPLLKMIRLFVFTDAGFTTLTNARCAEECIVVAGCEVSRDGSISCRGSPLDFYSRKIGRAVRSAIGAEEFACANGIEVGLRHHSTLVEILTGITTGVRPEKEDTLPLRNPSQAAHMVDWCGDTAPCVDSKVFGCDYMALLTCSEVIRSHERNVLFAANQCPAAHRMHQNLGSR